MSVLGLAAVFLFLWIPLVASAPFLANKMSLTSFRSSLLRPTFHLNDNKNDPTSLLLLQVRGGGQAASSTVLTPPTTSNETTTTVVDKDDTSITSDILSDESTLSSVPYNFSLFQKGDGSQEDPDGIPGRFLRMQKGNRNKAKAALEHSLEWRREHQVDTILSRPHAQFDVCKRILPHYFSGRDVTQHVIFVQRPGKINVPLGEYNNVTFDDLLTHYVFILEYCWNEVEPRPDQTMTSVIDLGGLQFGKVRKMLGFVKQFVSMMSLNYPQRSYKTLLINAPKWFGATYRLISPILRESTRSKIQILSGGKRQDEALIKYLGEFCPKELLEDDALADKENDHAGPNSPMEQMLRAFVVERLDETGEVMQPVLEVES